MAKLLPGRTICSKLSCSTDRQVLIFKSCTTLTVAVASKSRHTRWQSCSQEGQSVQNYSGVQIGKYWSLCLKVDKKEVLDQVKTLAKCTSEVKERTITKPFFLVVFAQDPPRHCIDLFLNPARCRFRCISNALSRSSWSSTISPPHRWRTCSIDGRSIEEATGMRESCPFQGFPSYASSWG